MPRSRVSHSDGPRALWVAPGGAAPYNQISRAINNKPFQCSYGRNYPHRRWSESAARVEHGDLLNFFARSVTLTLAHLCSPLPVTE